MPFSIGNVSNPRRGGRFAGGEFLARWLFPCPSRGRTLTCHGWRNYTTRGRHPLRPNHTGPLKLFPVGPAPRRAGPHVERLIASAAFAAQSLAPDLLLQFHQEIAGVLVPEWAGRWRDAEVR